MMLAIATSLSVSTIIEKKSASSTEFSVQSLQTADSGMQLAIQKINNNLTKPLNHADIYGAACVGGVVTRLNNAGKAGQGTYDLHFYSDNGTTHSNCGDLANTIQAIKSIGTYRGTVRAVNVAVEPDCPSTVSDNDTPANEYSTIKIGTQCWMAENLRTTKRPNGTDIAALAYCNPAGCGSPWGRLYDWNTAMNGSVSAAAVGAKIRGLCPTGWHIPADFNLTDDLGILSAFLGGNLVAGKEMKRTETAPAVPNYWAAPNTGVTNSSGFAGVGSGNRVAGVFNLRGLSGYIWSSYQSDAANAWSYQLSSGSDAFTRVSVAKTTALSIRCVKN
ncbi:MAG: Major-like protein ous domain protein [Parcubacteria group bacterium GW2011_GWD2_38_11]|nr:MAG: Major-like protein ous domain protein [Parcubacteria group bacterium GW2011_GWD2_38_11]